MHKAILTQTKTKQFALLIRYNSRISPHVW